MEILKGILIFILISIVFNFIWQWLSLPFKIDSTNKKLDQIIELLKKR